jgi:tetratricopeptide (TPR) repeat protein
MDRIDEFLKSLLDKTKEERDLLREKEHVCPSEETITCYLDKLLKDTEKEDFEGHLTKCDDCLQQIILLHDIKKKVEQSGYMEAPAELTQQAIRIDPDYVKAHCNLGIAYGKSGKYKEAIDAFKQAIRINPDYSEAHFNLGVACHYSNDRNSALEQYKILKNLDSELANKLFNMICK